MENSQKIIIITGIITLLIISALFYSSQKESKQKWDEMIGRLDAGKHCCDGCYYYFESRENLMENNIAFTNCKIKCYNEKWKE